MIGKLRQLLKPLNYLRIRAAEKWIYDWGMPLALTAAAILGMRLCPVRIAVFGPAGFVKVFTDLLGLMVGFYIMALTLVATLAGPGADEPLAGSAATLDQKPVDRRLFARYLFGFLSLASLSLYICGAMANNTADGFRVLFLQSPIAAAWLRWGFAFIYILCLAQLIIATLLGLYYLVDRIHRSNSEGLIFGKIESRVEREGLTSEA